MSDEQKEPFMTESSTERGFSLINFKDRYGVECSIQESSLGSEGAIWLGVDDADPQILASQAAQFGIATNQTTGWIPYPVPDAVLMKTRMHLTQQNVYELLPVLSSFAATGILPKLAEVKPPEVVDSDKPLIKFSADYGNTYTAAPNGLKVVYENVPLVIDGEDQSGMIAITHSNEGMITDVYGTRVEQYDTLIATAAVDFDQIVIDAILVDTGDEDEVEEPEVVDLADID